MEQSLLIRKGRIKGGIKGMYCSSYMIAFMLLILIPPAIIQRYKTIDTIFNILRIVMAILIFGDYFLRKKFSGIFCIIAFTWFIYTIFCLFNGSWDYHILVSVAVRISLIAMIESCNSRGYERKFYKGLRQLLLLYLIPNTISILMGNDVKELFLGFDNDSAIQLIPLIGVLLYGHIDKKDKIDSLIVLLAFLDFLITKSGSGMLTFFVIAVYYFSGSRIAFPKWIKSWTIILGFAVIWLMIYYLGIQRYIAWLIVNILGKDLSFSSRTYVWSYVLDALKDSWLFGYGNYSQNPAFLSHRAELFPVYSAHNIFLHVYAMGGVAGLTIFFFIVIFAFKKVDQSKSNRNKNSVLLMTLICYFLCGQVASVYALEELSVLLCIAYHIQT